MAIHIGRRQVISRSEMRRSRCRSRCAQQPPMPVIGFLSGGTPAGLAHLTAAFRQGLSEAGYVEGQKKTDVERRDS